MVERRATPAPRWPPRCCAWAASRASPAPRSRCRSRCRAGTPQILVDGGATVDCTAEWLVQFAVHGPRVRPHPPRRRRAHASACSPTARSRARATTLRKAVVRRCSRRCPGSSATSRAATSCATRVDVIVTDGFTGNVALKTLEGAIRGHRRARVRRARVDARVRRGGARSSCRALLEAADAARPRQRPAARCSSASTACASSRTARRPRRAIVQRGAPRARLRARPTSSTRMQGRRSPMPAETHVEREPDRSRRRARASSASASRRSSRSTTTASRIDSDFADDLDADSLALIELVEALEEELGERTVGFTHRRRRPRRPEDGARRGRLRRRAGSERRAEP